MDLESSCLTFHFSKANSPHTFLVAMGRPRLNLALLDFEEPEVSFLLKFKASNNPSSCILGEGVARAAVKAALLLNIRLPQIVRVCMHYRCITPPTILF
jgi:hypothetical protein